MTRPTAPLASIASRAASRHGHAGVLDERQRHVAAEQEQRAVGQVGDPQQPEDQRQPAGADEVQAGEGEAVERDEDERRDVALAAEARLERLPQHAEQPERADQHGQRSAATGQPEPGGGAAGPPPSVWPFNAPSPSRPAGEPIID